MVAELKRFADFHDVHRAALNALARDARRLRLPAGRWLVRPGRALKGRFYLLEGRLRLLEEGRSVIVNAGSRRARRVVYPGCNGVETLTTATFLRVDAELMADVLGGAGAEDPGARGLEVTAAAPGWEQRFLTSPLMARLDPPAWQRILRAMACHDLSAGDCVVRAGEAAECCYVLCSGSAEIRAPDGGSVVAVLEPGALFGEDALVSGRTRNASVYLRTAGRVRSLGAREFQSWLLDAVVRPLPAAADRPVISLDRAASPARHIPVQRMRRAGAELSPRERYAIVGGTWAERTLAAFLLAGQGIDAGPVRTP